MSHTKRTIVFLLLLSLAALAVPALEVTAHTSSLTSRAESGFPVDYEDSYFESPASVYNHKLAQASLGMALSAFRPLFQENKDNPSDNLVRFLTDCGFKDLQSDDYDKNPSLYTVATIIGSKQLTDSDGNPYTLVAVGICGGGYSNEWLSNFTIGKGVRHEGFASAAHLVENRVFGYIGRANIQGRIKIWISGFSRAAAISNITAADLVDCGRFLQDDIYAYTFATPRTTRDPKPGCYDNIFCIVGQYDPVPQVPFSSWGFERYGKVLYTPLMETDSDYAERSSRADSVAMAFTKQHFWANPSVNSQLHTLIGFINEVCPTQEMYVDCLQDRIIYMFENRTPNNIFRTMSELSEDERIINDGNREVSTSLINYIMRLIVEILTDSGAISTMWNPDTSLTANLMHEHTQDVYLTWMMSSDDPSEIFTENTEYTNVAFFGLKDDYAVRITEGDSELTVMEFRNGQFIDTGSPHEIKGWLNDDSLSIAIPHDRQYRLWYESDQVNESMLIIYVDFDTRSLAESMLTFCYPFDKTGKFLVCTSDGQRSEGDLQYYDFDASELEGNSKYLPAGFIANALGSNPYRLDWRAVVFMVILIPVVSAMIVVLVLGILISLISRKRIKFMPFLLFVLVMIGFIVGDLFFWLFPSVTPRTITKSIIGALTVLFALIGLMKRKKRGLLSSKDGALHIVLFSGVLLCAVADCVINYSLTWGMIIFAAVHVLMIWTFIRKRPLSAYQWFAFVVGCVSVLTAALIFRSSLGGSFYPTVAYGFLLSLLVVSGYRISTPVALACIMFAISDTVMAVYRSISSKLLVLHIILMFAYYLAIFALTYSCYRIKEPAKTVADTVPDTGKEE
ncbi:MAG: hypothetical protein II813_07530 [Spirochaetales bacterium]|nr:hypothetical protein [Spirochaetales bacterium]